MIFFFSYADIISGFTRNQAHPDQITIKDTIIEHRRPRGDDPLIVDFPGTIC